MSADTPAAPPDPAAILAAMRERDDRVAMGSPRDPADVPRLLAAVEAALALAGEWDRQAADHAEGLRPSLNDWEGAALSRCAGALRAAVTTALTGETA